MTDHTTHYEDCGCQPPQQTAFREACAALGAELAAQREFMRDVHIPELAEAQARANALRDALERVRDRGVSCYVGSDQSQSCVCIAREALATTPAANLSAYRKSVLEEAAKECDDTAHDASDNDEVVEAQGARECAFRIRALAAQEETK